MYRCELEGADGRPVDTGIYEVETLKAFTPPHGRTVFEIRKAAQRSKSEAIYIAVERGTPRHSLLTQLPVLPLAYAVFVAVYASLLRLLRLTAKAIQPQSD
ncbi:hypothetical protein [Actinomadura geliboluensis]